MTFRKYVLAYRILKTKFHKVEIAFHNYVIDLHEIETVIRKSVIAFRFYEISVHKFVIDNHKIETVFRKVVIAFRFYATDFRKKETNYM